MALFEKISDDLKTAMKAGDRARVEVLRFVSAGLYNAQKEKNVKQRGVALTDEEVVAVLQKEAKRRKEALELFRKGGREDIVKKEEADLAVIFEYLPKELSAPELEKIVDGLKNQGFNDFNSLMREAMKVVKGRADGKTVGDVIKRKIE